MAQLAVAVAGVQIFAGVYKGQQERKQKYGEGKAFLDASDRRKAAMTRDIDEAERVKDSMESRALAAAATLGGGALGTTGMTRILGDLNAEGEYNILATMYRGMEEADALVYRAEAARREGDAAFRANVISGVTSAVTSYYGMGGFDRFSQATQMEKGLAAAKASKLKIPSSLDTKLQAKELVG